jgi:hypothetical protein
MLTAQHRLRLRPCQAVQAGRGVEPADTAAHNSLITESFNALISVYDAIPFPASRELLPSQEILAQ